MIKKLKRLSEVLPDLMAGIIIYGILCEMIGVWFVKDKMSYSIGLLVGVICALLMAVHMAWSLNHALSMEEAAAVKKMQLNNLVRYGVLVLIFGILMISEAGNPLSAFLGVMGLKVAAYIQPITHKFFRR